VGLAGRCTKLGPRLVAKPRSARCGVGGGQPEKVCRRELEGLELPDPKTAQVLVAVNQVQDGLALNLKAPLVIHLEARLGRQIVAKNDHAVQYFLNTTLPLRKTA